MRTTTYPGLHPGVSVDWNPDGTYAPCCEVCGYRGKDREIHADAVAACRSHQASRRHRMAIAFREAP